MIIFIGFLLGRNNGTGFLTRFYIDIAQQGRKRIGIWTQWMNFWAAWSVSSYVKQILTQCFNIILYFIFLSRKSREASSHLPYNIVILPQ